MKYQFFLLGFLVLLVGCSEQEILQGVVLEGDGIILISKDLNKTGLIIFDGVKLGGVHPDGSFFPFRQNYTQFAEIFIVQIYFGNETMFLWNKTEQDYIDIDGDGVDDFSIMLTGYGYEDGFIFFETTEIIPKNFGMQIWWAIVIFIIVMLIGMVVYELLSKKEKDDDSQEEVFA